jgi:hypothetical protein
MIASMTKGENFHGELVAPASGLAMFLKFLHVHLDRYSSPGNPESTS